MIEIEKKAFPSFSTVLVARFRETMSRNDVWSAGLIAHTILSPDQDAFADKDQLRNYNELPPCYSAQIRGIVQRMLNVELGDRLTAEDAHAEMCGARAQLVEAGAD